MDLSVYECELLILFMGFYVYLKKLLYKALENETGLTNGYLENMF